MGASHSAVPAFASKVDVAHAVSSIRGGGGSGKEDDIRHGSAGPGIVHVLPRSPTAGGMPEAALQCMRRWDPSNVAHISVLRRSSDGKHLVMLAPTAFLRDSAAGARPRAPSQAIRELQHHSPRQLWGNVLRLLGALAAMRRPHRETVVHGDIRPGTIALGNDEGEPHWRLAAWEHASVFPAGTTFTGLSGDPRHRDVRALTRIVSSWCAARKMRLPKALRPFAAAHTSGSLPTPLAAFTALRSYMGRQGLALPSSHLDMVTGCSREHKRAQPGNPAVFCLEE